MSFDLPDSFRLASHDDIRGVVDVVVEKLGAVDSHAEMPHPDYGIPKDVIRSMLEGAARSTGLTVEQFLNMPHYPLVELEPVGELDRLAIQHYGAEAGLGTIYGVPYVARVVRGYPYQSADNNANIIESGEGELQMVMEVGSLTLGIKQRPATVADCESVISDITQSPGSRTSPFPFS